VLPKLTYIFGADRNPCVTSHVAGGGTPSEVTLEAVRYRARRVVDIAAALKAGRAA
jgi:NAD(P)H dehydrogenase (quinone)